MAPPYRVYVLQNLAQRFYIGVTEDVAKRLEQHNAGDSRWTRGKGPWRVVWESELLPLSAARKLENRLKRQGRGRGFFSITGLNRTSGS
jgi:putative endonuclease